MIGDLIINNKDAWDTWGVNMGDGFLDAIDAPCGMKDYIESESRLEHGKRIITDNPKVSSREFALHFTIMGNSEADFREKKKAFLTELQKGNVNIAIPALGNELYKLVYLGKNISYGLSQDRCFCEFSAKFNEPNPMDR